LISKIFNFATDKEILGASPAVKVPKPGQEHRRDRVLRDQEIKRLWGALESESLHLSAFFRLLLLTGQRKSEVANMAWEELDLARGCWEIPSARTKNKCTHQAPLVEQALEILKQLHERRSDEAFVFPGRRKGQPLVNLAKPLARLKQKANVTGFTIHDLRRTCATGMGRAGVPGNDISRVLNHISANGRNKTTEIYNKYEYDLEKRAALLKWDRLLLEIVSADIAVGASELVHWQDQSTHPTR
jgi:integrase